MPGPPLPLNRLAYQGIGMVSAAAEGYLPIVVLLWGNGESVDFDQDGLSPLRAAALQGRVHVVRFLIEKGADVQATTPDGVTALMYASLQGHLPVMKELIEAGADLTKQDHRGYTALHHAVHGGRLDALHYLCATDKSKSLHLIPDAENHTCLHWAAYKGNVPICRYLLEVLRVNVNAADSAQRTALHWAAREGRKNAIRYLLGRGATFSHNVEGKTPEAEARERFQHDAVEVFNQYRQGASTWVSVEPSPISSLDLLLARPSQALHILGSLLLVGTIYVASTFFIPWLYFAPSSYTAKIALRKLTGPKKGVQGMKDEDDFWTFGAVPYMLGGTQNHYYRDLWNLAGIISITWIQWSMLTGPELTGVLDGSPIIKYITFGSLFFCVVGFCALKLLRNTNLSPVQVGPMKDTWSFLQEGVAPHNTSAHCMLTGNKKGIRSAYLKEIDSVVTRVDHFNYWIDVAIGGHNSHVYFLMLVFYFMFQLGTLCTLVAWSHEGASGTCAKSDNFIQWNLLVHVIPCGVHKSSDTWGSMLEATRTETIGFWTMVVPGGVMLFLIRSLVMGARNISAGITQYEFEQKVTRGENNTPAIIYRGNWSVFSEGSLLRNWLVFFHLAAPYRNFESMEALPRS